MPIYGITYHKLAQTGFAESDLALQAGDRVLACLEQGQVLAKIVSGPHDSVPDLDPATLVHIERAMCEGDLAQEESNQDFARDAATFWKQCVRNRELEMKLVDVEVFFDRSKLIFYFTAVSRVDFRELVKDLVHEYRVRIEFRQIGVRHETQMIGAVGNCGMVCCCRRYLHQFAPVTIRMAKEQDLFLNPSKVSGICGRLLCCLAYEQESYEKFHAEAPRPGKRYQTGRGTLKVVRTNMFTNSVTCLTESSEELYLDLGDWKALNPHRIESPGKDEREPEAGPLASYGDADLDAAALGSCPEDDLPADPRPKGQQLSRSKAAKPAKQTFVTGRVHFRQQGKGPVQETWKQSAGLVPKDEDNRPLTPQAGPGERSGQYAQGGQGRDAGCAAPHKGRDGRCPRDGRESREQRPDPRAHRHQDHCPREHCPRRQAGSAGSDRNGS